MNSHAAACTTSAVDAEGRCRVIAAHDRCFRTKLLIAAAERTIFGTCLADARTSPLTSAGALWPASPAEPLQGRASLRPGLAAAHELPQALRYSPSNQRRTEICLSRTWK